MPTVIDTLDLAQFSVVPQIVGVLDEFFNDFVERSGAGIFAESPLDEFLVLSRLEQVLDRFVFAT